MSSASAPPFDPRNQTFFLHGPHNATIPVWVPAVDRILQRALGTAINYGSQIGACLVMLLVTLTMTSKTRFARASTVLNLAALAMGTIRCTLLALYFTSSFLEFYTFFSGDYSAVRPADTRVSAVATVCALPQLVLIEAALFVQASSMIRLWPALGRAAVLALSALVAVFAVGFKCATVAIRVRATFAFAPPAAALWINQADLAFTATTIFWFCFVFIVRLVLHMWTYRSILPPLGGVSAMEVLVMTNGILMLVPVIFAAMELGGFTEFEAGSLTYTSVIVVLPLGTLIAQSMTHRNGSGGAGGDHSGASSRTVGGSGPPAAAYGAYSRAASATASSSKKHLFGTWSHASDATTTVTVRGGGGPGSPGSPGAAEWTSFPQGKAAEDAFDQELKRIDAAGPKTTTTTTTTTGLAHTTHSRTPGRVWVDREVEVREEEV